MLVGAAVGRVREHLLRFLGVAASGNQHVGVRAHPPADPLPVEVWHLPELLGNGRRRQLVLGARVARRGARRSAAGIPRDTARMTRVHDDRQTIGPLGEAPQEQRDLVVDDVAVLAHVRPASVHAARIHHVPGGIEATGLVALAVGDRGTVPGVVDDHVVTRLRGREQVLEPLQHVLSGGVGVADDRDVVEGEVRLEHVGHELRVVHAPTERSRGGGVGIDRDQQGSAAWRRGRGGHAVVGAGWGRERPTRTLTVGECAQRGRTPWSSRADREE